MPKIVNTALKAKATGPEAKAKAIKFGLEAPRGQGLASRTTSLDLRGVNIFFCLLTPKRHVLARNRVIWRITRENLSRGLGCRLLEEVYHTVHGVSDLMQRLIELWAAVERSVIMPSPLG